MSSILFHEQIATFVQGRKLLPFSLCWICFFCKVDLSLLLYYTLNSLAFVPSMAESDSLQGCLLLFTIFSCSYYPYRHAILLSR